MYFGYNPDEYPDIRFRQLPLASTVTLWDVVRPSWFYADISLDTVHIERQTFSPGHRCQPTICPLLYSDMSPIVLCRLQHFIYSSAIALLIQPLLLVN